MCLINKSHTEFLVAKEDIFCYKRLSPMNNSLIMGHTYARNILYKEPLWLIHDTAYSSNSQYTIYNRGFHSRIYKHSLDNALFVIPKGSNYILGTENEEPLSVEEYDNYLSDQIIFLGKLNFSWSESFLRWKRKTFNL